MFFGLVQYVLGGKKYLPTSSLEPNDPIDRGDLLNIIKWVVIIVVAVAAILAALAGFGQLNVDNIITMLTVLAIALPIYYFVMMLRSSKVTKVERSRVKAYIPLFFAAAIFWGIEESGSVVLALFAEQRTVLHVGNWHFTAANFQSLNPLFIMILTPVLYGYGNTGRNNQVRRVNLLLDLFLPVYLICGWLCQGCFMVQAVELVLSG